eukprot:2245538-Heterocapsa_arctica.AAC.1
MGLSIPHLKLFTLASIGPTASIEPPVLRRVEALAAVYRSAGLRACTDDALARRTLTGLGRGRSIPE